MEDLVGLSPEQMQRMAATFGTASHSLAMSRSNVSVAVANAFWAGTTADRFRAAWAATMIPKLTGASLLLEHQSLVVRRQLEQQIRTSDAGGVAVPAANVPQWGAVGGGASLPVRSGNEADQDWLDPKWELPSTIFFDGLIAQIHVYVVAVSSYVRADGTVVAAYARWAPGAADKLKPFLGGAGTYESLEKLGKVLGRALVVFKGLEELWKSWGEYSAMEIAGRVATRVALEWGVLWASTAAGAAIGGPLGAAAGLVIGLGWWGLTQVHFGFLGNKTIDDWLVDQGGHLVKGISDGVGDAWNAGVDLAKHAGNAIAQGAANLKHGVENAVDSIVDAVWPW